MGAPGPTPKRTRSRSEMTPLCRHDRHRIKMPWGGRGVIRLQSIDSRTTMATFWGLEHKENAVRRASFRAEQGRRPPRVVKNRVTSRQGWRIKTILCPRKARFDRRDWGRWRPPRGRRTPRMAARRVSHGRAAFFCQFAEGSCREVREYGFIVISRERCLACSHRVAERRRALFRQLHIRERSAPVDRRPRLADDSRHQKHRRTA